MVCQGFLRKIIASRQRPGIGSGALTCRGRTDRIKTFPNEGSTLVISARVCAKPALIHATPRDPDYPGTRPAPGNSLRRHPPLRTERRLDAAGAQVPAYRTRAAARRMCGRAELAVGPEGSTGHRPRRRDAAVARVGPAPRGRPGAETRARVALRRSGLAGRANAGARAARPATAAGVPRTQA